MVSPGPRGSPPVAMIKASDIAGILLAAFAVGFVVGIAATIITQLLPFHRFHIIRLKVFNEQVAVPVKPRFIVEPVCIPIVWETPSNEDLARKVLAVLPDLGPTELAAILGCAKSTAHELKNRIRREEQ